MHCIGISNGTGSQGTPEHLDRRNCKARVIRSADVMHGRQEKTATDFWYLSGLLLCLHDTQLLNSDSVRNAAGSFIRQTSYYLLGIIASDGIDSNRRSVE